MAIFCLSVCLHICCQEMFLSVFDLLGKARVARSGADVPQSLGSPRSSAVVSPDKFPDSNGGKKQRNGSKGKLFGSRK